MLRGLRKASSNWLGKVIMAAVVAFLIASFAIWGIGDIFRGFGQSTVATVGNVDISMEAFRQAYNERVQQLGRQIGRPISPEQARALGIDRQVVSQMVAEAALDQRAHQMGLGVTNAQIAQQITKDPAFSGANGQFDRDRFEQLIRQAGFTEPRFVNEQRQLTLRRQLANTVTGKLPVPNAVLAAVNQYQNEQRAIDYVVLGSAQAGNIPPPTPDMLAKYFETHKLEFRAPEYRKVVLMSLSPEELGKWTTVSDADAKKYYEDHHAQYVTPERRHVRQIVFPNEAEAKAARAKIAAGTSFEAIASERKLTNQDIDLGTVTKAGIIDPAVAKAAFSLKPNEVSQPVKGEFGVALVQVLSIEPEKVRPYTEVANSIKHEIAMRRGKNQMFDLRDKIEDERAAGSTIAEIANKLKLPSQTVEIDRSGRKPDGTPAQISAAQQVLPAVFSTDVGVEADPVQVGEDALVYYNVIGITPSRERKLDEIKQQVEQHWREDQIAAKLKTQAAAMVDKLKSGSTLSQLASSSGLKVETAKRLTRTHPSGAITPPVLAAVFHTAKDTPGSAEGAPPDQVVFHVTNVTVPPLNPKSDAEKKVKDALQASIADAMLGEYLARIENDIGTRVNESAIDQAIGVNNQ